MDWLLKQERVGIRGGHMHYVGFRKMSCFAFVLVFALCWACAITGSVEGGSSPKAGVASPSPAAATPTAESATAAKGAKLLSVAMDESGLETVLRIAGSGPLKDYQFRRLGEDRFVLEIGDVPARAAKPALPGKSSRVKLNYARAKAGVRIVGNVRQPISDYTVDSVDNDIVVNLRFAEKKQVAAAGAAAEKPATAEKTRPGKAAARRGAVDAGEQVQGVDQQFPEYSATRPGGGSSELRHARKQYTGKPISLDLLDADLRNVLRLLADLTGTNIVIEPDVTGKVTLKVEQVPWDQVLDMIISMNDLGQEQVGSVIRIARRSKLKSEWAQQAEAIRAKQEYLLTSKDLGEINTAYLTVNYAQVTDVASKINEAKSDKGRVSVDERTSLIIYSDYPGRINNARMLLNRLDRPTSQVLIEARIITLTSEVKRSLGMNLGFGGDTPNHSATVPFTDFLINSPPANLFALNLAQMVGTTLLKVDLTISALETADEIRIMAAPRVLTMNNVKAVISQGVQIPYLKVGDTASNITGTDFKDAVLELAVTPHITPDHKVRMTIEAKQDEPSSTVTGAQGQPGIDTRKISTELLVDDGNIIVIGGIIRNRDEAKKTATPGLSDVPILGRLFKSNEVDAQRNEILIFICPKIVDVTKPSERT